MIIHDEHYDTRLIMEIKNIGLKAFCGALLKDIDRQDGTDIVLYTGEAMYERLEPGQPPVNCEACILIKFQIDSTKTKEV